MSIMYDSVNASAIPLEAQIVAGYVDGLYRWSKADWNRFPHAQHVTIAVSTGNAAMVGDCETGDMTPSEVAAMLAGGLIQVAYMNESTWPAVEASVAALGLPRQRYWVASYLSTLPPVAPTIPPDWLARGCVAWQYAGSPGTSPGGYDLSVTDGVWPGAPLPHWEGNLLLIGGRSAPH